MARRAGRRQLPEKIIPEKVVDETIILKRPRRGAKLREEVWQAADGQVKKYNLAYINHLICRVDNGRVLGYDNSHEGHHRHFMGDVEPVEFVDYQSLVKRFQADAPIKGAGQDEVRGLWRQEEREAGR